MIDRITILEQLRAIHGMIGELTLAIGSDTEAIMQVDSLIRQRDVLRDRCHTHYQRADKAEKKVKRLERRLARATKGGPKK